MIQQSKTLEFLIPSYKRPQSFIQAVKSVAVQVEALGVGNRVKITVVDDRSPNIDLAETIAAVAPFAGFVSVTQNAQNKGMSLNIRDMVAGSTADFCTILTDDDLLQPDSLNQIIETIDNLAPEQHVVGSFFVPRYSYLEDGSLHCIVCNPFSENKIIAPSSLSSLQYLNNGFILTGLFFDPKLINYQLWDRYIENGYFPVIYFADLLLHHQSLFINENWFIHTVNNECHWDSWGKTKQQRLSRLYRDYMQAVAISAEQAQLRAGIIFKIELVKQEFICYKQQMISTLPRLIQENRNVDRMVSFRIAYVLTRIYYILSRARLKLKKLFAKINYSTVNSIKGQ